MTSVVPTSEEDSALSVVRFASELAWEDASSEIFLKISPRSASRNRIPATPTVQSAESHITDPIIALRDALQNIFQGRDNQDAEDRRMNYFMLWEQMNLPVFVGDADPQVAENWLRVILKKLTAMKVPTEYWVGFATYKFEKMAEIWWKSLKLDYPLEDMTWTQFETIFRDNYCNAEYRQKMIMAYHNLEQENLTVLEYYVKFMEFSQYINSMDPMDMMVKFRLNLRSKIRHHLSGFAFNSLLEVVAAAQRVEADLEEQFGVYKGKVNDDLPVGGKITKKDLKKGKNRKGHNQDNFGGSSGAPLYSNGRSVSYVCHSCGQPGHLRKNCPTHQKLQNNSAPSQTTPSRPGFRSNRGFFCQDQRYQHQYQPSGTSFQKSIGYQQNFASNTTPAATSNHTASANPNLSKSGFRGDKKGKEKMTG